MGDTAISTVVVQYNEEIRDPEMKKRLKQDFRSRWGYITNDVFERYKKARRGELSKQEAGERCIVYLPDGTLADVYIEHMTVIEPYAVIELIRRMPEAVGEVVGEVETLSDLPEKDAESDIIQLNAKHNKE